MIKEKVNKVYLCHGSLDDPMAEWEKVYTSNPISDIRKGEGYTLDEIHKAVSDHLEKAGKGGNYKWGDMPTGNTWSSALQRKNWPSRWITYRGNRVLLKIFNQGKKDEHARIVFSANPAFEHLKIIPKTKEEYEGIKKEADKRKKNRKEALARTEPTKAELEESKRKANEKKEKKEELKSSYREKLIEIASEVPAFENIESPADLKGFEKILERKADRKIDREEEKRMKEQNPELMEVMEAIENEPKSVQNKAIKALEDQARKDIVNAELEKALGEGYSEELDDYDDQGSITGVDELDKKIKSVRFSFDQAVSIQQAAKEVKAQMREIDKAYKDDIIRPDRTLEITSLQGIGVVDFDKPAETADETVKRVLEEEVTRLRADKNTALYERLSERIEKTSVQNQMDLGTLDSLNATSNLFLEGSSLSRELVEFIGPENAARLVAGSIEKKGEREKALKQLEEYYSGRGMEVVDQALENIKLRDERVEKYRGLKDEGILLAQTVGAAIARQMGAAGRELGMAVGSLEAAATVIDALRDPQGALGDIVIGGGKNVYTLKKKLANIGLDDNQYSLKKQSDGSWKVTIGYENFDSLLSKPSIAKQRDQVIADIKSGKAVTGELPEGMNKTFFDWKKPKNANESAALKAKGYVEYKNKKGEAGYTSQFPEGTKLLRKEMEAKFFAPQEKAYKMAKYGKRVIWNLGAGTGKTVSFLAHVAGLKERGELDTFAFHTMPSRLRKEFFKDQEKFFPNMKVLDLDSVKSLDKKREELAKAAKGEYDMVISGHDSMKRQAKQKDIDEYVNMRKKEYIEAEKAAGREIEYGWGWGKNRQLRDKWTAEAVQAGSLPDLIRSFNPNSVTVDEAHEVIKSVSKGDSQRLSAFKKMAAGTEYFIPATGTVLKNDMGEVANLLHITRPDKMPHPKKWARQYENINQATTAFGDVGIDGFRKTFDDVMLTEHLAIDAKLNEVKNRVALSNEQKAKIKTVEDTYHAEKKLDGVGIMHKDSFELHKNAEGGIHAEEVNFNVFDKRGNMTMKGREYIKSKGLNPKDYTMVKLGRLGAAARRDSKYEKVLHGGDYKTNSKVQQMFKDFDNHHSKGERQIVMYDRKDSLEMLKKAFAEKYGFKEGQHMTFIDGSVSTNERNKRVTHFQTNPDAKVIFLSTAGRTGLNLQQGSAIHWLGRDNAYYKQAQGNARSHRRGREGDVTAYYHDSDTIYDDRKVDNLEKKRKLMATIGDPEKANLLTKIAQGRKVKKIKKGLKLSVIFK